MGALMTLVKSYQPTISKNTVKTGVPVSAGILNQMMAGTSMISKVKVLNRTHTSILYNYIGIGGSVARADLIPLTFTSSTDPFYIMIPTSPEASHLALIIRYYNTVITPSSIPTADISVEAYVIDPSFTQIDVGFNFESGGQIQVDGSGNYAFSTTDAYTGADTFEPPSGGYTTQTTPRPIYIPSAHRGKSIVIKIESSEVAFVGFDVLELLVS